MNDVLTNLYIWYAAHGRSLPWRDTQDAYAIWISEVILQQTRVKQGMDYYVRFLQTFPTVQALAQASEQQVLKAWEGLGYYSRARNLQAAAQQVVAEYGGQLPTTWQALQTLKGVGPYTARAIASFAFGQRAAVLDGNVFRVLSRLYADATPIDGSRARGHYQPLADTLISLAPDPALHNQAMIELGATLCTHHNPACAYCPLQAACIAYQQGNPTAYPTPKQKKAVPEKHYAFYIGTQPQQQLPLLLRKAGFWRGLYVFPHLALEQPPTEAPLAHETHVFTHFRMQMHLYVAAPPPSALATAPLWLHPDQLADYPLPKAMHKLLAYL